MDNKPLTTDEIHSAAFTLAAELLEIAHVRPGGLLVAGCSSSEIIGERIGTASSPEVGAAVFHALNAAALERGLDIAAQCCEHLNRALVVERSCAERLNLEIVNAIPQPKAGGSFATAAFAALRDPVLVASVSADAGIDFGGTLIGMHLRRVAVPVKLGARYLGFASVTAARTRPPFTGGSRAVYNESLL